MPDTPTPDSTPSWWLEDFASRLPQEQARMRREALPRPVQDYFDDLLKAEEDENLARPPRVRRGK